ncbi:MAG: hypothetical protein IPJ82_22380 [Lewinellaceae bacterium]|nr:hypothetical protein [Lewinellaceae bacterium]
MLGDTLPRIAFEKAGIIKPGVPVVIGETHPESAPVFLKKAAETGSEIVFADQHFAVKEKTPESKNISASSVYDVFKNNRPFLENLEVQAGGPFQAKNVATLIQAVELLKMVPAELSAGILREGLAHLKVLTRFMGRWQVIGDNPAVLCDSAHNEAGLRSAFEAIKQHQIEHARLHIVTGFVNDKDVDKVLGLFPREAAYYFAKANIPRGLEAQVLKEKAAIHGLQGRVCTSVKNALKTARHAASPDDLIVVIGETRGRCGGDLKRPDAHFLFHLGQSRQFPHFPHGLPGAIADFGA